LEEDITARLPRADQRKLADRVMGYVAKRFDAPLYARIDLVDNQVGEPVVLEVEAVEPSMFFGTQPTSYEWFVQVSLS
jgi:glutathionylspermidine synthase